MISARTPICSSASRQESLPRIAMRPVSWNALSSGMSASRESPQTKKPQYLIDCLTRWVAIVRIRLVSSQCL